MDFSQFGVSVIFFFVVNKTLSLNMKFANFLLLRV